MKKENTLDLLTLKAVPGGETVVRQFGMGVYTQLYLKWITNEIQLYSTDNSAQCYMAAWMGGEFGGEWTHLYMAECFCCSSKMITTL